MEPSSTLPQPIPPAPPLDLQASVLEPSSTPALASQQPDDAPTTTATSNSKLPRGQCRYILTMPELKGHRCACVGFSRDKALPGATCDCGHQSCFHLASADVPSSGKNRDEIEVVRRRVQVLEQQAAVDGDEGNLSRVVSRVSQLEETMDRNRYELQGEVKGSYRNISAAWQLIEQMQRRMAIFEETHRVQSEQLARAGKELQDLRNRNLELLETDEMLEERIERLEGLDDPSSPLTRDPSSRKDDDEDDDDDDDANYARIEPSPECRPMSSSASRPSPSTQRSTYLSPDMEVTRPPILHTPPPPPQQTTPAPRMYPSPEMESQRPGVSTPSSQSWTVHVSLLPSRELPLPYEKDTNAYKRCLSRGLQRMIAVEGTSAEAFVSAVTRAFHRVLQDVQWEPLRAKLCDARKLEGHTMLRPLESEVGLDEYTLDFLREHCAVCDADGKVQSLYLAPRQGVLSWAKIKSLPVYVDGLDASWEHDQYLDRDEETRTDDAEDVENRSRHDSAWSSMSISLSNLSSSPLKRAASEMQSTSLATGGVMMTESEDSRASKSRKCMPGMIEIL